MEMITSDRWNEEVWGAATSTGTNRQDTANFNLIFYWGQGVYHHSLVQRRLANQNQGPLGCKSNAR